jgi:hypothetical protein
MFQTKMITQYSHYIPQKCIYPPFCSSLHSSEEILRSNTTQLLESEKHNFRAPFRQIRFAHNRFIITYKHTFAQSIKKSIVAPSTYEPAIKRQNQKEMQLNKKSTHRNNNNNINNASKETEHQSNEIMNAMVERSNNNNSNNNKKKERQIHYAHRPLNLYFTGKITKRLAYRRWMIMKLLLNDLFLHRVRRHHA